MGFVVGKDITKEKQDVEKKSVEDGQESSTKEKPEDTKHQIPQKQQEDKDDLLTQEPQKQEPPGNAEKSSPIDKILSPFTKLGNTLVSKLNFTKPKADTSGNILEETQTKKEKLIKTNPLVLKRIAIVGGFSFVLILILVFLFWFYFPKAIVSVYVSTKYIDDKIELSVNPNSTEVNFELREVQGKVYTKDISGDKTKSTSGSKTVGEKARGVVTLYRSGSEIDLEEGTIITGPGDLEFTLNEDTKVASGSAATPGTTDAAVTAADIGAQYNLALGETFAVANYLSSDIEAKNESDFSGGTSKQISSVSEEDRVSLEDELTKELEEKALELIKEDLDKEQLLVTDTVTSTIVDREFSDKVGDEASTLKLSMTIEVDALVVDGPTLIAFSKEILKDKIPKGYVLKEDQIDFNFGEMSVDDDIYKLDLIIEANLLPEINIEEIRSHISGKSSDIAKNYLTTIQGFSRAEIDISFNLPGTAETLPRVKSRILIEVTRLEE